MERRGFLSGAGTVFATAIAGCNGTTGGDSEQATTATDAVEGYFEALADGDRETANQFAHPDGDYYLDEDHRFLDAQNLTISETEVVDLETGVRRMYEDPEDVELDEVVEDEQAALESIQDEYGFDDYAYVRHDAVADSLTFNSIYVLFEDGSDWVIWSVPTFHLTG